MGNAPSHQGGTPPHEASAPAPPPPLSKDKEPAKPSSPPPPSTPLLMPYGGHLSPQNPHALGLPQAHDYSKTIVTALILDQQLAPFYRGLDDYEEDWSETEVSNALAETREKDFAEQVENSATSRLRQERETIARGRRLSHEAERAERQRREEKAYLGALECPICFLYYPPNINTSRCCQQPLCTECFVQIKRAEATTTHLESEPACCPFCVETDFGVIYERPNTAIATPSGVLSSGGCSPAPPPSALATTPDGGTSAFSNALSDEPLSPGVSEFSTFREEGRRRKSVSSKAKEVVTIDAIRPDWEAKLNAVKAQAARRAARRIVMRQVGDRLIPIGYTSSRATGQADFSMSIPPDEGGSRRSRRTREREREMEEMMIMEAMRLSLLDHEEHLRKQATETKPGQQQSSAAGPSNAGPSTDNGNGNVGNGRGPSGTSSPTPSTSSRRSSRATDTLANWRQNEGGRAAKLLSKITVNRSRANSKSSVHFAPSPTGQGSSTPSGSRARSSSTPSPAPGLHPEHAPSPLSNAVTRRSFDIPGTGRGAAQALQAALGPGEPTEPSIAEVATPAAEAVNDPLARELAAATTEACSTAPVAPPVPVVVEPPLDSPLTELAPPAPIEAAPGQDLLSLDSASDLAPETDVTPRDSPLTDTTPAASPSRRAGALPDTPATSQEPSPAATGNEALAPTAPIAPSTVDIPKPVPKSPTLSPFKPKPNRTDTSTSLVSVDAASFVSHSSLGDDEMVRRPSGPLAARADD
ncbi:hypothetical protein CC85DRAFT_328766 [Cutaneotrichosporon oleaginosum]|uniref:RING-type domain-containing protein n=1 Tax=Cutaneotrichosporon oleaginosum TaxID=879819 RepID=A0A0J0XKZ3_9TREE|nr:uncharacterized protein CC85DRAFT_328766 [Cutaneotrichosporon oleaginosum]KLT41755.1 hypothetical protein CC85DRAFT_328766 [Cutaneotrichosporon oleaginosum]TXT12351.1 hypothetical protein COLE_02761 [Cutaneotrichosporon oleaginosum]